jgi:hypothetical protein
MRDQLQKKLRNVAVDHAFPRNTAFLINATIREAPAAIG